MKILIIALAVIVLLLPITVRADSMAAVLDGGIVSDWWCLHQDGSYWVDTGLDATEYGQQYAISWCAAHGYSW